MMEGTAVVSTKQEAGLSEALSGSKEQRVIEEKTILIKMTPGTRPEVVFTGFWTGKYIKSAMDSISRAYRLRRSKMHPARTGQPKPTARPVGVNKGGKGDV